jgi:diacylglycerol kinase (ATP)
MKRILFVINPISGGIGKRNIRQDISNHCPKESLEIDFLETTGKKDAIAIKERINSFTPDIVVACGGDGTINLVSQVLIKRDILLGIIPMGSANGLATELEIPNNIEGAVEILLNGHKMEMDVLVINKKLISLHLADLGFNANLIKRFEKRGQRGKLGYARHFLQTLLSQKTRRYYFKLEGKNFSRRAQMVTFANARKYGTGAVVNPDGKLDDGRFEVCIFKPYPWYALLGIVFRFFTGTLNKSKYVKIISTQDAIVFVQHAEVLQVDGEAMSEYNEVHVTLHPDKLRVIKK